MAETAKKKRLHKTFLNPEAEYDSDVPLFIFQSRSPSPSCETSAVQGKEISPEVHKAEKKADRHRGQGNDKPRPKKQIDNIDFLSSAVLRGATNVEVIRPDAATPMLDSKLARPGLINTCVEPPHVTSVDLQVNYMNCWGSWFACGLWLKSLWLKNQRL